VPGAILIAAIVVACALVYLGAAGQYQLASDGQGLYRLNTRTGQVDFCMVGAVPDTLGNGTHFVVGCSGRRPER
jgi:hypothetical protein